MPGRAKGLFLLFLSPRERMLPFTPSEIATSFSGRVRNDKEIARAFFDRLRMSGRGFRMSGRKCSLAWELFFPGWFFDFVSPLPIPPSLQGEGE